MEFNIIKIKGTVDELSETIIELKEAFSSEKEVKVYTKSYNTNSNNSLSIPPIMVLPSVEDSEIYKLLTLKAGIYRYTSFYIIFPHLFECNFQIFIYFYL